MLFTTYAPAPITNDLLKNILFICVTSNDTEGRGTACLFNKHRETQLPFSCLSVSHSKAKRLERIPLLPLSPPDLAFHVHFPSHRISLPCSGSGLRNVQNASAHQPSSKVSTCFPELRQSSWHCRSCGALELGGVRERACSQQRGVGHAAHENPSHCHRPQRTTALPAPPLTSLGRILCAPKRWV